MSEVKIVSLLLLEDLATEWEERAERYRDDADKSNYAVEIQKYKANQLADCAEELRKVCYGMSNEKAIKEYEAHIDRVKS